MRYDAKIADLLAFSFTIVILIFASSKRGLAELHPGAARYYREVGVLK